MRDAEHIRKLMEALNERGPEVPYQGKVDSPEVSYDSKSKGGEIHKVIANLTGNWSGKYTKLGRNLLRIERINARVNSLKEEVKDDTRVMIADLFNADDACRTREVETINFLFKITADPVAATTYKYKEILDELEEFLTPDLLKKKEELMEKYKQVNAPKPASIKLAKDKAEEGLEEGIGDIWKNIKAACRKFYSNMLAWGQNYDARLDLLKAKVAMSEAAVQPHADLDTHSGVADIKWGALLAPAKDKILRKKEKKAAHQHDQRKDNKAYIDKRNALRQEGIEEGNPLSEEPDSEDPRVTGKPLEYRGWEIGYDSEAALWTKEGYYCHVRGWEPGDPDGEDGTRSTAGLYWFGSVQDCKDQIDDDLDGEPLVKEDDGDWHSQDDLADYNNAEADDYRHEGDEFEGAMDVEDAILFAATLLGTDIDLNSGLGMKMRSEIGQYAHQVTVHQNDDGSVDFDCADPGSVNLNYNPLLTARVENGHVTWDHAPDA
jgi:hypothetical protein